MASFKRVRQVIVYGLTSIVAIVTIITSSLQTAAAQESNNPLALGEWLDGVPTRYVSRVLFDDVDFNRYRPYAPPPTLPLHTL